MDGGIVVESTMESLMDVDFWGWTKSVLFYLMLTICAAQTFYPILMIIAMFIRQLGFLAQYFHEVEEKSEQHGGEIIGQVLKAHGVEHIFTTPARDIAMPLVKGAEKNGIKVVFCKNESTAVAAADANSRLTGLPGVVVVTGGPGTQNTIAALNEATKGQSAVVVIGMSSGSIMKEDSLDVANIHQTMKPHVKWAGRVDRVRDIAYELREGLRQGLHGTPGPVYIQFTLDSLHPFPIVKRELEKKVKGRQPSWFQNYYLQNLFAAGFDVGREIRPWPIEIPFPKKDCVAKSVKTITKSEKPVILMGSQAILPPIELTRLQTIVQDLSIPVFSFGTARGVLPPVHPLHLVHGIEGALHGADLVILLGVSPADLPSLKLGKSTQILVVDRSKVTLKKLSQQLGEHATHVHSDVGQFLIEVSEKIGRFAISNTWVESLQQLNQEGEAVVKGDLLTGSLDTVLPHNTTLISDGSSFGDRVLALKKGSLLQSVSTNATLYPGYSIGSRLGRRDAPVVTLVDHSNVTAVLSEIPSASSQNVPLIFVVNGGGSSNLESLTNECGGKGLTGSATSPKSSIESAFKLMTEGSVVLLHLK